MMNGPNRQQAREQQVSPRDPYAALYDTQRKDEALIENVKLLPLKTRKIFKKAMRELDQVDLINSD